MSRSIPHYLNDQCSRILRNIPYPLTSKVSTFPYMESPKSDSVVAVLCGKNQFLEGLWSLWSWKSQLRDEMGAILFFDGKLSRIEKDTFRKLFPGGQIIEMEEVLNDWKLNEALRPFIHGHLYAKKFAAIYELQKQYNVLYSDCDVLLFAKPVAIVEAVRERRSVYLHDEIGYRLDPWIKARAAQIGLSANEHFNAGLVFVPKGEMKGSRIDQLLSGWSSLHNHHFAEQTLFSLMLDQNHSRPLPKDQYILSWQGVWLLENDLDCNQIVCRHYTGPTRHRMYLSAYPHIYKRVRSMRKS